MRAFTIGKLSSQSSVNIETIRYYERISLLPLPQKSARGTRQYVQDDLKRLSFIKRSRELGFSISEIRELLQMVDSQNYTCSQIRDITKKQLENVKSKVRDLQKIEGILSKMVAECSDGAVPNCPIIDTLYPS